MPLDNVVLENAFFPENESVGAKAAIRTDGKTLGSLLSSFAAANTLSGTAAADRFARFGNVANALLGSARARLGDAQAAVFQSYIDKFSPALSVQGKLLALGSKLGQADISLDLKGQFDLAFTLMEAGLSRVVTLCLGAPNATNRADPNGLFDAHTGPLYRREPVAELDRKQLDADHHDRGGDRLLRGQARRAPELHPLKNKITVCMTSEFARQGNLNGNERSSQERRRLHPLRRRP